jgi:hypothetical protein
MLPWRPTDFSPYHQCHLTTRSWLSERSNRVFDTLTTIGECGKIT